MVERPEDVSPDDEEPDDRQPGSAVERARPSQPAPPDFDAEQLRQFQEFQRYQEFLRLQETQGGKQLPPGAAAPGSEGKASEGKRRRPWWLLLVLNKYFRRLIYLGLALLVASLAYDYSFGGDDSEDRPAAETGGGTYHTNQILSTDPQEAVRKVYRGVGNNNAEQACGRFEDSVQQEFAENFGADNCGQAIAQLHGDVENLTDYVEPDFPPESNAAPFTGTARISSCAMDVTDGPRLGLFSLTEVEKGQWLITGHEAEADPCPAPATTR